MSQIERFIQIEDKSEVVSSYVDVFRPPTCPELENKYKLLFENLPKENEIGDFTNAALTFAQLRTRHIQAANLWLLGQYDNTDITVFEKNPYSQLSVGRHFGEHNGLAILEDIVFAGVINKQNNNFYIVRPVYGWVQNSFKDKLTKLYEHT